MAPQEKKNKALEQLRTIVRHRTTTIGKLEELVDLLNFLNRAIFPGRAFTRWMYAKFANKRTKNGKLLKQYHHISVDAELKLDCNVWIRFLQMETAVCWLLIDLTKTVTAEVLNFYSNASKNKDFGFGCIFDNSWIFGRWPENFITEEDPSIEYLELFGLCAGIFTSENDDQLTNTRVAVFCDNQVVVQMVNNSSLSCKHCMHLIRMLVLNNLTFNRHVYACFVRGKSNKLADSLSRMDLRHFWRLALNTMNKKPTAISPRVWLITQLWKQSVKY